MQKWNEEGKEYSFSSEFAKSVCICIDQSHVYIYSGELNLKIYACGWMDGWMDVFPHAFQVDEIIEFSWFERSNMCIIMVEETENEE